MSELNHVPWTLILIIETKDLRRLKRQRLLARLPRIRDFRTKVIVIDVDFYVDVDDDDDDLGYWW